MRSETKTVEAYLKELPDDRKAIISKVREVILKNLPEGYEEVMNWGMITYQVPLEYYSKTYNRKPLMYAALASQKNHMAVYLTGIYIDEEKRRQFESDYIATGKKLNAGKSCVRFKNLNDLPLDLIGKTIGSMAMDDFIDQVEKNRSKS
ncbi:MAG: DUF1801 domain-containing protein [Candidatus Marinimicrobia bacterium]|nr:DUF1801 domain-containing protein [Candidatus Neomarinimicrobiota bacterium]